MIRDAEVSDAANIRRLMRTCFDERHLDLRDQLHAKQDGWKAMFVLGAPAFYERFGFSVARAAPFVSVYPKRHFMAMELLDGICSTLDRRVEYPSAFARLGA